MVLTMVVVWRGGVDNGGVEVLVVVTVAKKLGRTWWK